jgi:hypothetical protein
MFVLFLGFGTSILAGSLTLGIMTMPVVISTAEEAILAVPQQFRTVSLSLGASRWQTIRHQVLPHALPGIITGIILGLGRAAGETAPILFTVAAFYLPELPARSSTRRWRCPIISTSSPRRCPGCRCRFSTARSAGAAADRAVVYAGGDPGAHADAPPPRMVRL